MAACNHYGQLESTPAAIAAADELLKTASSIVRKRNRPRGKPDPEGRPKIPRQEIIRRSKDWLEEQEWKPVLVRELAAAVEVSERTLRTAFNEYFGIGPVSYIQLRQLHQVHHKLQKANSEIVCVSDILVEQGVWEFSRFARRYRRLFGELPSETLRKSRQLNKN